MGDDGIEWELEDLDGGVLYDVFYESTTMLAGRMLAQRRLAAARGDRDGERRAEADRRGLLAARDKVGPTDRRTLIAAKRSNDAARGARAEAVAPWHAVDRLTVIDRDGGVLYDGADPDMFAGQWERGFHRPLSAVETADARMRLARIGSLRSVPGVGTALSDPVVASIRRSLDELA